MRTHARRILYVEANEDGTVGGSYQCVYDLASLIDKSRYCPVVLFYQNNRFVTQLEKLGVEVHTWDEKRKKERMRPRFPRRLRQIWKLIAAIWRRTLFLRRAKIDLVHLNDSPTAGFDDWLPAAWLLRRPCIAHARSNDRAPAGRLQRWLFRGYSRIVAISEYVAKDMRAAGIDPDQITLVYDGIDIENFRRQVRRPAAEVRKALKIPPDSVLVSMVGHLRSWKGQDVVLAALQALDAGTRTQLRVIFVGGVDPASSDYFAELKQLVAQDPLHECVAFLGERSDVPDLMNAADIILHASTVPEPFGLVVLEGMALCKPVIASRLGGPMEVVTPESGLLFDPAQPNQLATILERLARDESLRQSIGEAARKRVNAFNIRKNVTGVEKIYASLLQTSGVA